METLTDKQILDLVADNPVDVAASQLLEELNGVGPGKRVAVIDDDAAMPYAGLVGTVKGEVPGNNGHVLVQFASGRPVYIQVNQLVPVPS